MMEDKEERLKNIKSGLGTCMQMLINIEKSRTPIDRTRSTTPVRRSTMGSPHKSTKFRDVFGKSNFDSHKHRGAFTTSITTSKILIDKGFTGPQFIEDDIASNIPVGDEIPQYFPEDFDFSVPYPLHNSSNFNSNSEPKELDY